MGKGEIALAEVFILLLGTMAFACIIGEMKVVSAADYTGGLNIAKRFSDSTETSSLLGTIGKVGNGNEKVFSLTKAKELFTKKSFAQSIIISASVYGAARLITGDRERAEIAAEATGIYYATDYALNVIAGKSKAIEDILTFNPLSSLGSGVSFISVGTILSVGAAVWFALSYKKSKTEYVEFTCKTWDSPTGGSNCEKCNNGDFPCTEYRCKSLGQGCELIEDQCIYKSDRVAQYPVITLNAEVLSDGYKYSDDNAISPPNRGVIIQKDTATGGCITPYSILSFGINTNEPARCRVDIERKNFDEMGTNFGSDKLSYNHTLLMPISASNSSELQAQEGREYLLYIKCQDGNGKETPADFVFKFCVEPGVDKTTPTIIATSPFRNGGAIAFEETETPFSVYIDEPGKCRWSTQDKGYDDMENTMTCSTAPEDEEADFKVVYRCSTTLTGLKDRQDNKFYFRCEDNLGNKNTESFEFTLKGTQPLLIDYVKPNGTIKDSTETVKVYLEARTSSGADEGKAKCQYSSSGDDNTWVDFYYEDGKYYEHYEHKQVLDLETGDYDYYIRCEDMGGNSETKKVVFSVESDTEPPAVIRVYKESNDLKIITSEEAECVYDTKNCNYDFNDGLDMTTVNGLIHSVAWKIDSVYYIKCRDDYGNEPYPDECDITVKPIELS